MITSLVVVGVTDPTIKTLPFFIEIVDEVDDLCNIRGIFAGKKLFTSHQVHQIANIQSYIIPKLEKLLQKKMQIELYEKHAYCLTKFHQEGKYLRVNENRKYIPLDKYYLDPVEYLQVTSVSRP